MKINPKILNGHCKKAIKRSQSKISKPSNKSKIIQVNVKIDFHYKLFSKNYTEQF